MQQRMQPPALRHPAPPPPSPSAQSAAKPALAAKPPPTAQPLPSPLNGARKATPKAAVAKTAPASSPAKADLQRRLLEGYKIVAYRLAGKWFERENQALREQLRQADLRLSPGLFRSMAFVAALGAAVAAFAAGLLAFFLVMPSAVGLAVAAGLPVVAGVSAWVAFPAVLKSRIQNRRQAIDRELPFSISELSVLASIGLSPIQLVRRMAARTHDPAMTAAFAQIVGRVDTEGKDLVTALADAARESPSPTLREIFWDLANLVHQGGDLEAFLRLQSDHVLESLRATQTGFTEQLGTYADMYITVVLLGVMFVSVGAFMLNAFQATAGGISADGLVLLITYGFMPLVLLVLSLLLSAAYEKVRT